MSIYSITFSPTGGTQKVSSLFMQSFSDTYTAIDLTDPAGDFSAYKFNEEDICVVSVPSYGGRVPLTAVERLAQMQGSGAKAILIVVYGNREFEDTLVELQDVLQEAGFVPVAAVAALAEHSIIRTFAAGRPDAEDAKVLAEFAKKIKDKIENGATANNFVVPGNRPYKERKPLPAIPNVNEDCTKCGLCAKECPVQAIPADLSSAVNKEMCISCMRCISICPVSARAIAPAVVQVLNEKLSATAQGYKKNQLFLCE